MGRTITVDGCTACAHVVHATNEIITIYPITPSSPIQRFATQNLRPDRPNIWGNVPNVGPNAVGSRSCQRSPWLARRRRISNYCFRVSGAASFIIPNMYRIARGTFTDGISYNGPFSGMSGPFHIRRPF